MDEVTRELRLYEDDVPPLTADELELQRQEAEAADREAAALARFFRAVLRQDEPVAGDDETYPW